MSQHSDDVRLGHPAVIPTLAVGAVALLWTNLVEYAQVYASLPVAASWIAASFVGAALLLACRFTSRLAPAVPKLVLLWIAVYLLTSALSAAGSTAPEAFDLLQRRLLSGALLAALLVLFSIPSARAAASRTVAVATVFAVAMNLYDWYNPLTFSNSYGRAAGLYVNPNISGAALTLGVVVGLHAVAPRWRELFVAVGGLGVALTFSRGALLSWALVAGVLLCARSVRPLRFAVLGIGAVGCAVFALAQSQSFTSLYDQLTMNRPELATRFTGEMSDVSGRARRAVAEGAWNAFVTRPLTGDGLGATSAWQFEGGTHNVYLMLGAEHGIVGLLLVPSLLSVMLIRRRFRPHPELLAGVAFLAFWGMLTHNMLDEWYSLIGIALLATSTRPAATTQPSMARLAGLRPAWRVPRRASAAVEAG